MLVVFWVVLYKQERWSRYSHQRVRARLVEQLLLLERELLLHVPVTSRMRLVASSMAAARSMVGSW